MPHPANPEIEVLGEAQLEVDEIGIMGIASLGFEKVGYGTQV